ncbi:MAG: hypothetical protein ACOVRN_00510 [Flavobacterium sp.]|jgi:hypothetical protein
MYITTMSTYAEYPQVRGPVPDSQRHPCESSDTYTFERERLGKTGLMTSNGEKFGPYLYRNRRNRVLLSSWDKPVPNKLLYKASDIGWHTDALIYYKNE